MITRPADDFRVGDRVYDWTLNTISIVGKLCKDGFVKPQGSPIYCAPSSFFRIIEAGETIPKGAVTREIMAGGLTDEHTTFFDSTVEDGWGVLVLVSLPEPEPEDKLEQELEDVRQVAAAPIPVDTGAQLKGDTTKPAGELNTCYSPVGTISSEAILQAAATIYAVENRMSRDYRLSDAVDIAEKLADLITQKETDA